MLSTLRTVRVLISGKTVAVAVLSVLATYLCRRYGITADFPLTLIAIAVVFPIVFSIGGAYKRREAALDDYGSLKAHGTAIYFAARDWLSAPNPAVTREARQRLGNVLDACRVLFTSPQSMMRQNESDVYQAFSELSDFIRTLRGHGLASGEVSRCNQYLSKMMVAFESVKHVYQYRTPISLRSYSDVFIVVLPVVYGPYFADIASSSVPWLGFLMPVLFSVILVSLDNIQDHLENPFDQIGDDDIHINVDEFVARLAS